jgi:hypothetical protein
MCTHLLEELLIIMSFSLGFFGFTLLNLCLLEPSTVVDEDRFYFGEFLNSR